MPKARKEEVPGNTQAGYFDKSLIHNDGLR